MRATGLATFGGIDGVRILGERGFVDAVDDVVHPLQFLGLLAEFAPIAAGGLGIHFLDELVRGDAHFVGERGAEACPPALAFLVEFPLLGEVELAHDHRADLVVEDDRIRIGVGFLGERGDGGGHRGGEGFHDDMHRRVAGFHGFEDPVAGHHRAAGAGVDDDENGQFAVLVVPILDAAGDEIRGAGGDQAVEGNAAVGNDERAVFLERILQENRLGVGEFGAFVGGFDAGDVVLEAGDFEGGLGLDGLEIVGEFFGPDFGELAFLD